MGLYCARTSSDSFKNGVATSSRFGFKSSSIGLSKIIHQLHLYDKREIHKVYITCIKKDSCTCEK